MSYDLKELGNALKEKGLDVGEEAVKGFYVAFSDWLKASARKSPSIGDDILLVILPYLDGVVLPQIDKIDGNVDLPDDASE